ncbi:MAG: helix-turn-helix transcriptional regulator [Proteobacteria bacterium]|nr:helix-turn-helix transcriptional regulator [Pseudomonadota bacterium]
MEKIMATKPMDIASVVKQTRKAQGLTQAELAGAANTGLRFIIDLEAGKPTCQIGKVLHIVNMLGISIELKQP